jgi:hypothetical protein
MTNLAWAILLVGAALAGEVAWAEYRERRMRREEPHRRRLFAGVGLLPPR